MLSFHTFIGSIPQAEARLRLASDRVVHVSGVLNFQTTPLLLELFDERARRLSRVVVDLSEVLHADSAGLALLVEWMRRARRRNQMITFRALPEQLVAIARVCNLCRLLPVSLEGLGLSDAIGARSPCEDSNTAAGVPRRLTGIG